MKRSSAILAIVTTLGTTATAASATARGIGPGLAFGLAAGALTATAVAATARYYYSNSGPHYCYGWGPVYSYRPGRYTYYGGPFYYRHQYWYQPYW